MNDPLEIKIRIQYRTEKNMKKLMGKIRAREIAFGRKLVKLVKTAWCKGFSPVRDAYWVITDKEGNKITPESSLECSNKDCRCKLRKKQNERLKLKETGKNEIL